MSQVNLDPENASTYNSRALVYDKMELYAKALSDFNWAINIDPSGDHSRPLSVAVSLSLPHCLTVSLSHCLTVTASLPHCLTVSLSLSPCGHCDSLA